MNPPVKYTKIEFLPVEFVSKIYSGDVEAIRRLLEQGVNLLAVDKITELSALGIAIGRNHMDVVRLLLDYGAPIAPEYDGRWPSTIAELCEVDGELCDLIADVEAKAETV